MLIVIGQCGVTLMIIDQVDNIIIGKLGCTNVTSNIKAMVTYSFDGCEMCGYFSLTGKGLLSQVS